jgi:hypothetical protein
VCRSCCCYLRRQQANQQALELNQLNTTRMHLIGEKEKSQLDRNKIQAILNQTQFPFGKLPLNLDESVAAFPVALGIGFVLSASYLANSIHLRKELHIWYKIRYRDIDKKVLEKRVLLLSPLWIDPLNAISTRIIKSIIFVTPFVIFVLSCYMICYYIIFRPDSQIASLFSYESFTSEWAYLGLYLICTGFFIFGIWNVIRELRRY